MKKNILFNKPINKLIHELLDEIKDYVIFKPKTKNELQSAIDLWCLNKGEALIKYGNISDWDTSMIDDMSELFKEKNDFNDNISNWDVSNVKNMKNM